MFVLNSLHVIYLFDIFESKYEVFRTYFILFFLNIDIKRLERNLRQKLLNLDISTPFKKKGNCESNTNI
jgi:hypothetical protein